MTGSPLDRATRLTLLGIGAACLALVAYLATRQGAAMGTAQVVVFYGIPVSASALCWIGARARVETRLNVLLALAASVGALYLAEMMLAFRPVPQRWPDVIAARSSPDPRMKAEVIRDLRAEGVNAYATFSPWVLRNSPLRRSAQPFIPLAPAPAHSTVVQCNEGTGWIVYETDSYGFRSRAGNEGHDSTFIALIGDSYTLGECVSEDATIAGQLRRRWAGTKNLGVPGSGPLHQLAVLKEYAARDRPSIVVWTYYEANDMADFPNELSSRPLLRYLEPGYRAGLAASQEQIDGFLASKLDSAYHVALDSLERAPTLAKSSRLGLAGTLKLGKLRSAVGFPITLPRPRPWDEFAAVLSEGRRVVSEWGGTLVLVYMPGHARYGWLGSEAFEGRQRVLAIADSLGLPVVDLSRYFSERVPDPRALWIDPRGHPNARGYALAAEGIESQIQELVGR